MSWEEKLEMVEEYIKENGKLPPYDTTSLGPWITRQKKKYKEHKDIMVNTVIREKWEIFTNKYSCLFKTNEEKWKINLKMLYEYVEQYNKLPSEENKNKNIKSLGKWISEQKLNYKGRKNRQGLINRNEEIKLSWEQFVNKYPKLFRTNIDVWKDNLEEAEKYIKENNKTPSLSDKNTEIKRIAKWLYHQNENYKDNTDIFNNNEDIKTVWIDFINQYKFKMFMTNEAYWMMRFDALKKYIQVHNKLPSNRDTNKEFKHLGIWLGIQKKNYTLKKEIMKEDKIREEWEQLVKENQILFMTNEEIWVSNYNTLKAYIEIHHKLPSSEDNETKSLYRWIQTQKKDYMNSTYIMKENKAIELKWEELVYEYPELFRNTIEVWYDNLKAVKEYVEINNKLPSKTDSDVKNQQLSNWITSQKQNYKGNKNSMTEPAMKEEWEKFVILHSDLFKSNIQIWQDNLEQADKYIIENNKLPPSCGKNEEIKKLGCWVQCNKRNYVVQSQIMKDLSIRKQWDTFMNKYKSLFRTNEEKWTDMLNDVEKYIIEKGKTPSSTDKIEEIKQLGSWILTQKYNYTNNKCIMKDLSIRQQWEEFICKYSYLF
jgi:hypothetical protein